MATTTLTQQSYTPKKWDLAGLQGISDNTLTVQFGLDWGSVERRLKLAQPGF
jgi:hypothetical protein